MTVPTEGENPLLKLADQIGLNPDASPVEDNSNWTPDQMPPAMAKAMASTDDVPDFEAFAATFGRAAGGKGIVMNQTGPEAPKPAPRGYHKDGSPRDVMESLDDCLNGFCAVCK